MSALRKFIVTELVAIATLLLVAAGTGVYGALEAMSHDNPLVDPRGSAWLAFAYTAIIGALPVICFGVPIYLALLRGGSATWANVMALGATPGVLLLFVAGDVGLWAILCGVVVAGITHLACRRLGVTVP